ncbi:MAG: phosphoribosylformylglycinamidine synthase [Candidatus Eremiobacteraeota bacterium]|nr:phosphoribosylformylglycinamidine synthase [Candidatus Eremiobacteraeota bacterium]
MPETPLASRAVQTLGVLGVGEAALVSSLREHGLALKADEMQTIAARLGRDPTLVECHAFDAQWSEHCSYKSSRVHLGRVPTEGPDVILGPGQDAGIVRLGAWQGESYGIVVAHESHNHPSQVVPFEGAATGVGGIVRDVLCMGARVIGLADPLRFGPLDDSHSRYVAQGVVDGIAAYGNAIGVPTIAGDVFFGDGFRDNCLVNVVALGLVKEKDVIHSRAPAGSAGWDIVLVGKATDRSGFGGAAFSSLVLDDADAQANKSAVQVPDPFLKNVIMRASYRAFDVIRELGLTVGFKDLGAGGIMGCTAELVASGGFGARINLDLCPTTQPDLPAAVIAVGETQERLTWVVPPSFTSRLLQIYNEEFSLPEIAQGAQAAVIGRVTEETEYVLTRYGEEVMRVPIEFLTSGIKYDRPYAEPEPQIRTLTMLVPEDPGAAKVGAEWGAAELGHNSGRQAYHNFNTLVPFDDDLPYRILSHRDVCSRKIIYERYDSVVRGATSIPAGYADAGVLVPIPGSPLAMSLSLGGNPRYGAIDPALAAEHAVVEAVCNAAAVGARPLGLTDCLNFGNPENACDMGAFVASVNGLATAARELGLPFVSGNVSLYNQSANGNSIPPSAIVACVGGLGDVSRSVTPGFKGPAHQLYFIGEYTGALGGSVLADVAGLPPTNLPNIDYARLKKTLAALRNGIEAGLIYAIHDVSDGGIFTVIAEMAFATIDGARIGASVCLDARRDGIPLEIGEAGAYFGEHRGFIVEADRGFAELLAEDRLIGAVVGATHHRFDLRVGADVPVRTWKLDDLYESWSAPLRDFYEDVPA